MSSGIFIIQNDDQLIELTEKEYDSEAVLQGLIAKHPGLLAGKQIDNLSPRRWLLISREMPVPLDEEGSGWMSLDHLFLDQDAIPTLVEVKRSTDTRIRREVIGQMLDYAANAVVYWPLETIRARYEANSNVQGQDPDQVLAEFLVDEATPEDFWYQAQNNLKTGKVRLLFVADEVPSELQRIVEFLNEQMNPAEVLAVEIKQFAGHGLRTLVPRVLGQTAEAQQTKGRTRAKQKWDDKSFFADLERRHETDAVVVAKKILAWAQLNVTRVRWGEGSRSGSFVPILNHKGTDHQLFAVWTNGGIEIYFYWYKYKPPFDNEAKRVELLGRINAIEGVTIPDDGIDRRPSFFMGFLDDDNKMNEFFEIFEWFIGEVQGT